MTIATVENIRNNAKQSKTVWENFLSESRCGEKFRKYFHLRPTENGVTIVSTLSFSAMRGLAVDNNTKLKDALKLLCSQLDKLVSEDTDNARKILEDIGFKERVSDKTTLEENIQANFIRGLLMNAMEYEGVQFVASELILGDGCRLDVVGIKGETLYIFELKKDRKTKVFEQVKRYATHIRENISEYQSVLSVYPNLSVHKISDIKGVAVMRFAENSPLKKWEDYANASGVDIWMFKEALSFEKINSASR